MRSIDTVLLPNKTGVGFPSQIVVVGNPGKRIQLFQEALARLGLLPAHFLAYRDILTNEVDLQEIVRPGAMIRLESPGQDFEVEKMIIAAGAEVPEEDHPGATQISKVEALRLAYDKGRIWYPRQWYRGYQKLLQKVQKEGACIQGVRWMNAPSDLQCMFNKPICQQRFLEAQIPVPDSLGVVHSFDELHAAMVERRSWRVFIKLAHGSSASGVVALSLAGSRVRAITTVEMVHRNEGVLLYNSRRLRVYESFPEVVDLLNSLCREGVQVEKWVPKAAIHGKSFDLRVVVVAGQARHIVVRTSNTPMTNLHLLNKRGNVDEVCRKIDSQRWLSALQACERAAGLFPSSLYAGVDLLFTPTFRWHCILEINAFGDLLPGVLWEGMDTYETELRVLMNPS